MLFVYIVSVSTVVAELERRSVLLKQEHDCIKNWIVRGVERRDIETSNGECWIKTEAKQYYE